MQNVIVLNIAWKRVKFSIDLLKSGEQSLVQSKGLYQIYGRHNAYGRKNALLYIGKTHDSFAARVSGRWEFIESSAQPKYILLGRFLQPKDGSVTWTTDKLAKMITVAENLLILAHSPAMNKQGTTGLFDKRGYDGQHYLILNWENYGSLLPEVSTLRNSYQFWDFDTPVGWGEDGEKEMPDETGKENM